MKNVIDIKSWSFAMKNRGEDIHLKPLIGVKSEYFIMPN